MKNKLQCKHIPSLPILRFIDAQDFWCNTFPANNDFIGKYSVLHVFPDNCPWKLMIAKMRNLIARGLISGCACGCRGDFEILPKGVELLERDNHPKETL